MSIHKATCWASLQTWRRHDHCCWRSCWCSWSGLTSDMVLLITMMIMLIITTITTKIMMKNMTKTTEKTSTRSTTVWTNWLPALRTSGTAFIKELIQTALTRPDQSELAYRRWKVCTQISVTLFLILNYSYDQQYDYYYTIHTYENPWSADRGSRPTSLEATGVELYTPLAAQYYYSLLVYACHLFTFLTERRV